MKEKLAAVKIKITAAEKKNKVAVADFKGALPGADAPESNPVPGAGEKDPKPGDDKGAAGPGADKPEAKSGPKAADKSAAANPAVKSTPELAPNATKGANKGSPSSPGASTSDCKKGVTKEVAIESIGTLINNIDPAKSHFKSSPPPFNKDELTKMDDKAFCTYVTEFIKNLNDNISAGAFKPDIVEAATRVQNYKGQREAIGGKKNKTHKRGKRSRSKSRHKQSGGV